MKLFTLGTSHGGTEIGHSCSGSLLCVGDDFYLFDCGGDIERKMNDMKLPVGKIKAVFISHMHADHTCNLPAVIKCFLCGYNKMDTSLRVFIPDENGLEALKAWVSVMDMPTDSPKCVMSSFNEGLIYEDDNVKVYSIRTEHMRNGKLPSFAFRVEFASGESFLYTGDLNCDFHDYPKVIFEKDFDMILSELVHFNIEKNLDTIIKSRTKKLVFTHYSPRNIPIIENVRQSFPFEVFIANDGDCFEFSRSSVSDKTVLS